MEPVSDKDAGNDESPQEVDEENPSQYLSKEEPLLSEERLLNQALSVLRSELKRGISEGEVLYCGMPCSDTTAEFPWKLIIRAGSVPGRVTQEPLWTDPARWSVMNLCGPSKCFRDSEFRAKNSPVSNLNQRDLNILAKSSFQMRVSIVYANHDATPMNIVFLTNAIKCVNSHLETEKKRRRQVVIMDEGTQFSRRKADFIKSDAVPRSLGGLKEALTTLSDTAKILSERIPDTVWDAPEY